MVSFCFISDTHSLLPERGIRNFLGVVGKIFPVEAIENCPAPSAGILGPPTQILRLTALNCGEMDLAAGA